MMVLGSVAALADVPTSHTIAADSAADATTSKYTISVPATDDHTYTVYQILTGTLIAGQTKLGNPVWGADTKNTVNTNTGVDAFITSITQSGLSNTQINDLVAAQLKTENPTNQGTVTKDSSLDVVPGYYLLVDTSPDAALAEGEAKSLSIVAVFNDIEIATKTGTTQSDKGVDDQNDSDTTDTSAAKESADYDIGDTIPYTLTFTLPADYANYKKYYVSFVDDMSAGLTYNGDAKIYFGSSDMTGTNIGTAFAADNATTSTVTPVGTVYRYTIDDLKAAAYNSYNLAAGSVIKITYTATLNKNAVVGVPGNPNKYQVEYSRNPNQGGDGTPETGKTPWDINIVFTYKTVFNKVDADQKPLTGADFRLDKFVEGTGSDTYNTKTGTWTDVTTLNAGDHHPTKTVENLTKGEDTAANAKFTFAGLDAGVYRLTETQTPTGYNTIEPIVFTITAEHALETENPALTSLTGADGAEFEMTTVKDSNEKPTGELDADIKNTQGAQLPSTGGIGTTIFYVAGSLMVLAAAILLITKRRMGAND